MIRTEVRKAVRRASLHDPSLKSWGTLPRTSDGQKLPTDVVLDCGWGRLVFAHTFRSQVRLVDILRGESSGQRDIAFYIRDPHVLLARAPQELFLDPSHTYRLWLSSYRPAAYSQPGVRIQRVQTKEEIAEANRILLARHMVPADAAFVWRKRRSRTLIYLVAHDEASGAIVGTVTGIDHEQAFGDPEHGSSLWSLAVDPQSMVPGVGEALVRYLAEWYAARGRAFMDLSVMHDNAEAIRLYEKVGFQRVPVFCMKKKNAINEQLFSGPEAHPALNPYALIIVNEARRRGIIVDVLDAEAGYFRLSFGGRSVTCRESLSELTSAVAMSLCDDKELTRRVLERAGLDVPAQQVASSAKENDAFLRTHHSVVVKPARGEQGAGITVDVETPAALKSAIAKAERHDAKVLLEAYVQGVDLRIVVIDFQVVAAAVRKPPRIRGTGRHTVRELIEKLARRRAAATGGESQIPIDDETERLVGERGYGLDEVLPRGEHVVVRKTANVHTGGTIHDVTAQLSPALREVAVRAARTLDIPVVGLDLIVSSVRGKSYAIIEANERPGLANHEPQPTAERFIDLIFPQTASAVTEPNGRF